MRHPKARPLKTLLLSPPKALPTLDAIAIKIAHLYSVAGKSEIKLRRGRAPSKLTFEAWRRDRALRAAHDLLEEARPRVAPELKGARQTRAFFKWRVGHGLAISARGGVAAWYTARLERERAERQAEDERMQGELLT